jgi:hypothetical protein
VLFAPIDQKPCQRRKKKWAREGRVKEESRCTTGDPCPLKNPFK